MASASIRGASPRRVLVNDVLERERFCSQHAEKACSKEFVKVLKLLFLPF